MQVPSIGQFTGRPEPLMDAAAFVALVGAVLHFARLMGWVGMTEEQYASLMGIVAIVAPIVTALIARPNVTPLSDPQNNAGDTLEPWGE